MSNILEKTYLSNHAKTKAQLLAELNNAYQRIASFETAAEKATQSEECHRSVVTARAKRVVMQRPSDETYRFIFDNDIYAIATYDLETWQFFEVNEAFRRLYGYSQAELLDGMTIYDLTAEVEVTTAAFQQGSREGTLFIPLRYHRKKDGPVFPVEFVGGFHTWQGRKGEYVIVHNISERKRMEKALRESEARLRAVLANNAIVIFDQDQALWYTQIYNPNPHFTVAHVLGKTDADLFLPVMADHPEVSLQLLLTPAHSNSPTLIQQLKANSPNLKVIYLVDEIEELSQEWVDFMNKPFTPSSLVQKVRAVLEGRSA